MNRILIAEDEPRIAAFIEKGLMQQGFATAIAHDGEMALQFLKTDKFDLLLLDIQLPIKSGWLILEELKSKNKHLPIIVISACFDAQFRIQEISQQNHQYIEYVSKPFRFADLLTRVKNIFSLHSSWQNSSSLAFPD